MSYGAPWERGVGAADSMPQRDMEVPGLVPNVGGVELVTKQAQRHRSQHSQRQRRREEKASRKGRSLVDRDRCLDVIAEVVDGHRRELKVISRALDLCESSLCSSFRSVRPRRFDPGAWSQTVRRYFPRWKVNGRCAGTVLRGRADARSARCSRGLARTWSDRPSCRSMLPPRGAKVCGWSPALIPGSAGPGRSHPGMPAPHHTWMRWRGAPAPSRTARSATRGAGCSLALVLHGRMRVPLHVQVEW